MKFTRSQCGPVMRITAPRLTARVLLVTWTLLSATTALAQTYPAKPVRIVVGAAAGGPIDLVARLTTQKLTELLEQAFVVENRPGAGGTIAGEHVARAARDGYTLFMGSAANLCIAPAIYPRLGYDSIRDFSPISVVATTSFVLVVHPSVPAHSVKQFIALAKARPGQLRFGSASSGSATHLAAELFRRMAQVDATHVPYKGGSQAIIDVLSGQIDFMFDTIPNSMPHLKAARLRGLGVSGTQRSALMPVLPTIDEAGVPGYQAQTWFGMLAPAGTPRENVERLSAAAQKAVAGEELKKRMLGQGLEPVGNTPEQFARLISSELPKWAKVVQASGAKVD